MTTRHPSVWGRELLLVDPPVVNGYLTPWRVGGRQSRERDGHHPLKLSLGSLTPHPTTPTMNLKKKKKKRGSWEGGTIPLPLTFFLLIIKRRLIKQLEKSPSWTLKPRVGSLTPRPTAPTTTYKKVDGRGNHLYVLPFFYS